MHKGALKRGYNYGHYRVQRVDDTKIKKSDMYNMLDNEEQLLNSLKVREIESEFKYQINCAFLDKVFGVKTI